MILSFLIFAPPARKTGFFVGSQRLFAAQCQHLVAQLGGLFKIEVAGGGEHLLFQAVDGHLPLLLAHAGGAAALGRAGDLHQFAHGGAHRLRRDAVFLIVGLLDGAAAVRLLDGAHHRIGEAVGVHDDAAVHIARRAADGLDQRRLRAQKALLVGVENGHKRDFGKVQALAQQVDAHQHVVFAQPQGADEFDALQRFHIGMQVFHAHFQFAQIAGQAFSHALGERRHQHAAALPRHLANFAQQVVHLIGGRADDDLRVEQARGADDLLHHLLGALHLVGAGRGGDVDGLRDALLKFMELQGRLSNAAGRRKP